MNLQEATKHAQDQARDAKDSDCAEEHRQLAAWLEELDNLRERFFPYVKDDPNLVVYVKVPGVGVDRRAFHTLKKGDIFKIVDVTTGRVQGEGTDLALCVAQGVPFLTETPEAKVYIWGIMVHPFVEHDDEVSLGTKFSSQL